MKKYALGIDFGTLSARALVAEIGTGREVASAAFDYDHGVMDRTLPDGTALPPDFALQHPTDYTDSLVRAVREAVRLSGVSADDIVGMGLDFTACTLIPVDESYTPLCLLPQFASEPHAYVKLWKHHGAQEYANRMTEETLGEDWLARYGGKISSEWMIPKIWETLDKAPHVYDAASTFIDAGDWIVHLLTGREARSCTIAGYKCFWSERNGYPDGAYFAKFDEKLRTVIDDKLTRDIRPVGERAGLLTEKAAELLGLKTGIAVAVANVDAHVSLPAAGLVRSGDLLMIMGTSICHILLGDREQIVPGMCGVVKSGVIPGLYGFEAGQSCGGDHYAWATRVTADAEERKEAEERGISLHALLTEKAARLAPGESGLLALDWWNGNRSVLVDANLTGMILGMTLRTRGCEIYRALIEATAYGTRKILDTFEENGVPILRLAACGGIARKNPLVMQIFADVTGREIRVARSAETPALGSAIWGAVAAGRENGGYDHIETAAGEMGGVEERIYSPSPAAHAVYEKLYREYEILHDYFGRGENDVMKRLIDIRNGAVRA